MWKWKRKWRFSRGPGSGVCKFCPQPFGRNSVPWPLCAAQWRGAAEEACSEDTPDGMGAGAQGVFPPWAHVEPVSPPTYLCGKNKVTHSVLLQEPSIGAFTKMRRNRLAPRCRWVRHNISSAAMTLGPRRASCEFSGSRRRGSPGLSPAHSPVAGPAAPRSASQVLLPGQPAKSLPQPIKSSGGKQEAPVPLSPQSPIPAATAVPLCFRVQSPRGPWNIRCPPLPGCGRCGS